MSDCFKCGHEADLHPQGFYCTVDGCFCGMFKRGQFVALPAISPDGKCTGCGRSVKRSGACGCKVKSGSLPDPKEPDG